MVRRTREPTLMNQEPVRKGRGCFFYGCFTLIVVVVLGVAGAYFGIRYVASKAILKYTDSGPMTLPKVEVSAEEAAGIQQRFKSFKAAIEAGAPAEPLVLAEKELNALITASPDFAKLKDKIYVSLDGSQIKGQVSLPMDDLPLPTFVAGLARGRFLNGAAGLNISLNNGLLLVTLQTLEVKGEPLPEQFLAGIRQQNLAQEVYKDAKNVETLGKLESVEIKDGAIEVRARAGK